MASPEHLTSENAALRVRIAELEAALAAKPRLDRGALYALVDALPVLVAAVDTTGAADYANAAFGRFLDPAAAPDAPFLNRLHGDLRAVATPLIDAALSGEGGRLEAAVPDNAGDLRDLHITVMPRRGPDGAINGAVWIGQDTTDQRRAGEALAESEQRLRLVVDGAAVGAYDTDLETGEAVWSASAFELMGVAPTPDGKAHFSLWNDRIHPEDRDRVADEHTAAAEAGGPWQLTYRIIHGRTGETRWLTAYGRFLHRPGKRPRSVGVVVDVTNEKRGEARLRLLIHELNHRVKNTLAAVQSIARSSLRSQPSPEAAHELFTARLMALSAAHDVLTRETWEGAGLKEIIAGSVRAYDSSGASRFLVEGVDVRLAPKAAVALAMALHELATNAAKYGALSNDSGRVVVRWDQRGPADTRRLELEWRELGGPPVTPPTRSGFGSRLLRQGLKLELGASARMTFDPAGLICVIEAPLVASEALDPG